MRLSATDQNAIERALEIAPTPWAIDDELPNIIFINDANGKAVDRWPTDARDLVVLLVEAVNAYAANRAQAEQVSALVEALRAARKNLA